MKQYVCIMTNIMRHTLKLGEIWSIGMNSVHFMLNKMNRKENAIRNDIMRSMKKNKRLLMAFSLGIVALSFAYLLLMIEHNRSALSSIASYVSNYRDATLNKYVFATPYIKPSPRPTSISPLTTTPISQAYYPTQNPTSPQDDSEWGIAKEIEEGTYSIKVGYDDIMATPQEVFSALNSYRSVNGASQLSWDDALAGYASGRAQYFASISSTDKHVGFNNFLENENGFDQLGFRRLGENSYYGGKLTGVHLIEWVFAKSPGHNANQLDNTWTHVGIGVTNSSADLIFASEKL